MQDIIEEPFQQSYPVTYYQNTFSYKHSSSYFPDYQNHPSLQAWQRVWYSVYAQRLERRSSLQGGGGYVEALAFEDIDVQYNMVRVMRNLHFAYVKAKAQTSDSFSVHR